MALSKKNCKYLPSFSGAIHKSRDYFLKVKGTQVQRLESAAFDLQIWTSRSNGLTVIKTTD